MYKSQLKITMSYFLTTYDDFEEAMFSDESQLANSLSLSSSNHFVSRFCSQSIEIHIEGPGHKSASHSQRLQLTQFSTTTSEPSESMSFSLIQDANIVKLNSGKKLFVDVSKGPKEDSPVVICSFETLSFPSLPTTDPDSLVSQSCTASDRRRHSGRRH